MRTVIFIGLIFVGRAINPEKQIHEAVVIIMLIAMLMDVIEFLHTVFFKRNGD